MRSKSLTQKLMMCLVLALFMPLFGFVTNHLNIQDASNGREYAGAKQHAANYLKSEPGEKEKGARAGKSPESSSRTSKQKKQRNKQVVLNRMPAKKPMLFGLNQAGADFGKNFPGVYNKDYTYPTTAQLDYMQTKGFAILRLPFKWERLQRSLHGELDQAELTRLKAVVDAARARNQWVLLDLHNYCRRSMNGQYEIIGSPALPVEAIADFWGKLANEFKGYDNIWGYGLMNEPHDLLKTTSWFAIAQACINQIRTVDKKNTIVVGGDRWSSAAHWLEESDNLKNLKDPSRNLVYEAHLYFDADGSGTYKQSYEQEGGTPHTGVERAKPFVEWLQKNKLKGFIGEYGIPDSEERWFVTLDNLLQYLQNNGVGGMYWAAGPWWGNNFMAVEPRNGKDQPQMKVLEKYTVAKPAK